MNGPFGVQGGMLGFKERCLGVKLTEGFAINLTGLRLILEMRILEGAASTGVSGEDSQREKDLPSSWGHPPMGWGPRRSKRERENWS